MMFNELKPGDFFLFNDCMFVKCVPPSSKSYTEAVCIETGILWSIFCNTVVKKCEEVVYHFGV